MKKITLSLVVGLALVAAVYAATNVVSVNVVGYNKQDIAPSGAFTLIAPAFDPVGGGSWTLGDLFGTNNLTKSFVPSGGDNVYLWNTGSASWDAFWQKTDGLFYNVAEFPAGAATNPAVAVGEGFFIQGAGASTNTITLLGEVVAVGTQSTEIVTGFQTLGYPFSADAALGDMAFTNKGTKGFVPSGSDNVYVWENGTWVALYMKTDNLWYRVDEFPAGAATNVTIKIGEGFWYQALGAYTNDETSPYIGNL